MALRPVCIGSWTDFRAMIPRKQLEAVNNDSDRLTGSLKIDLSSELGVDGSKTIEGVSEGIDSSAKEFGSDGDIDDSTGSLDGVTFLDKSIVTEDDNTNVVSLQVQGLKVFVTSGKK